ncbi:MAG: hypothetical protein WC835_02315 [Candidatus Paceibacterota bacterium]|jgi:hypothetical protein
MENLGKHGHDKLKICVSGAAETGHCGPGALEKAKALGREVVSQGGILLTGATTGFPLWAAMGAKEAGGVSIGFSPASSEKEHLEVYRLPIDYMDLVVYTGFGYSGRDLLMTRSADAVLIGCGRIGTVHEFTISYEDEKPTGILRGDWDMDEVLKNIIDKSNRINNKIIFDESPERLVKRAMEIVRAGKGREGVLLNGIGNTPHEVTRRDQ